VSTPTTTHEHHLPDAGPDWSDLVRQDRVHRSLYTDPAIFVMELSRVFGYSWLYLAHESQLRSRIRI